MIKPEYYATRNDGVKLNLTYSDKGVKIHKLMKNRRGELCKTKRVYDAAIDIEGAPYIYEETDIPVDEPEISHETKGA